MEHVRIWNAYPEFDPWVNSKGKQYKSWYKTPTSLPGNVGFDLVDYIPSRTWTEYVPGRSGPTVTMTSY